jgi:hypothetical protein
VEVAFGTLLKFRLEMDQLTVAEPEQSVRWLGSITSTNFRVSAPPGTADGEYGGILKVFAGGLRICRVYFTVSVVPRPVRHERPLLLQTRIEHVSSAYASYARTDWPTVASIIDCLHRVAPRLHIDLGTSERDASRNVALEPLIGSTEMFCLFWSEAAKSSKLVDDEWHVALNVKSRDQISPIPLDDTQPPPELADLFL